MSHLRAACSCRSPAWHRSAAQGSGAGNPALPSSQFALVSDAGPHPPFLLPPPGSSTLKLPRYCALARGVSAAHRHCAQHALRAYVRHAPRLLQGRSGSPRLPAVSYESASLRASLPPESPAAPSARIPRPAAATLARKPSSTMESFVSVLLLYASAVFTLAVTPHARTRKSYP